MVLFGLVLVVLRRDSECELGAPLVDDGGRLDDDGGGEAEDDKRSLLRGIGRRRCCGGGGQRECGDFEVVCAEGAAMQCNHSHTRYCVNGEWSYQSLSSSHISQSSAEAFLIAACTLLGCCFLALLGVIAAIVMLK